ncbi:MAG TPA: hypothetical protein VHR45_08960 [Thermoanaerobaculia bacterium]|nr:hypothetical protein [Thermoanaerobaculia bacterium]
MTAHRSATYLALPLLLVVGSSGAGAQVSAVALLPSSPTTIDRLQITLTGFTSCALFFDQRPQVSALTIRIDIAQGNCTLAPPSFWSKSYLVGPLSAGTFGLSVYVDQRSSWSSQFAVTQATLPPTELYLNQGRFEVDVTWQDSQGGGSGYAKPVSDASGYFWFFDSGNAEITVKILDGRAINGHFWVFVASMTDVGFTVAVRDRGDQSFCPAIACPTRTYVNPLGRNQNFIDTNAF